MMRPAFRYALFSSILLAGIVAMLAQTKPDYFSRGYAYIAGIFFAEKISPDMLRAEYNAGSLKILIVPGHEQFTGGTEFNGLAERDLNLALAGHLKREFTQDTKISTAVTRTSSGDFAEWLKSYIVENNINIALFRQEAVDKTEYAQETGQFETKNIVSHNNAPPKTALVLYGINKYANDNNYNIVIHIHFNDYPGRANRKPGKYNGFSIYIPENQLPNARSSKALGNAIANRLDAVEPRSNYKKERPALVEDQELIAIGSYGTRDGASLLIEYGYIYEKKFVNPATRDQALKDLARATYLGIEDYFNNPSKLTLGQ